MSLLMSCAVSSEGKSSDWSSPRRAVAYSFTSLRRLSEETGGAFDPTSGPLIRLWRRCRDEGHVPTQGEIDDTLEIVGMRHVRLDEAARNAVQRWKFVPARRGDEPVSAWVIVPISFVLES